MKRYLPLQYSLFETAVARATDPVTSHQAADEANKLNLVQSHQSRIMAVLEQAVQHLTPREIAAKSGLSYHQVQRRIGELQKKGEIRSMGIRDRMRVWEIIL